MRTGELTIFNTNTNQLIRSASIEISNGASYSGPETRTMVSNITFGRNVIIHGMGAIPRIVGFKAEDTSNLPFNWQLTDGQGDCDPYNKILVFSADAYSNVEVNLIAY